MGLRTISHVHLTPVISLCLPHQADPPWLALPLHPSMVALSQPPHLECPSLVASPTSPHPGNAPWENHPRRFTVQDNQPYEIAPGTQIMVLCSKAHKGCNCCRTARTERLGSQGGNNRPADISASTRKNDTSSRENSQQGDPVARLLISPLPGVRLLGRSHLLGEGD